MWTFFFWLKLIPKAVLQSLTRVINSECLYLTVTERHYFRQRRRFWLIRRRRTEQWWQGPTCPSICCLRRRRTRNWQHCSHIRHPIVSIHVWHPLNNQMRLVFFNIDINHINFFSSSLPWLACEEKQHSKRKEISSRPWFSTTPTSIKAPAGSLLHRINQQSKEAAVAKALGSSHSPLVRKRIESSESGATITQRQSDAELDTRKKGTSELTHGDETAIVSPVEEGTAAQGRGFEPLTSLVPDYNDSDSDPGQWELGDWFLLPVFVIIDEIVWWCYTRSDSDEAINFRELEVYLKKNNQLWWLVPRLFLGLGLSSVESLPVAAFMTLFPRLFSLSFYLMEFITTPTFIWNVYLWACSVFSLIVLQQFSKYLFCK